MAFIYKISNDINDKIYIGETARTIEERWEEHKRKSNQYDYKLQRAFRKYGFNHFKIEKVEECSYENRFEREKYWIKFYNSFYEGYNSNWGGEGGTSVDYELIHNMWLNGYKTKEICHELKIDRHTVCKALLRNDITTNEIIARSNDSRLVWQYDLNGNFIKSYESAGVAAKTLGISREAIIACCSHRTRSAYNFLWKYADDEYTVEEMVSTFKKSGKGSPKKVAQYDLDDNLLNIYSSCRAAAKAISAPYHIGINSCCLGRQKTAYGYKWSYLD